MHKRRAAASVDSSVCRWQIPRPQFALGASPCRLDTGTLPSFCLVASVDHSKRQGHKHAQQRRLTKPIKLGARTHTPANAGVALASGPAAEVRKSSARKRQTKNTKAIDWQLRNTGNEVFSLNLVR